MYVLTKFNNILLYILPFLLYRFSLFLLNSYSCLYSYSSNREFHVFCCCLYHLMTVTGLVKWTLSEQESTCLPRWLNDGVVAWILHFNLWTTYKFSLFYSFLPQEFWKKTYLLFLLFFFFFLLVLIYFTFFIWPIGC